MKILTAAEMKQVDLLTTERHGVPSLTLMERAGQSVAGFIVKRFPNFAQRRIVVLCGKGNNGGDGFVVARHLQEMGAKPVVLLFAAAEDLQGDAATNRKRWQDASGALRVIRNSADWKSASSLVVNAEIIVDALLGTGLRGPVEGLLAEVIREVNARRPGQSVVAVDIPSGLPADTGEIPGPAVQANCTVTFTAPKAGMFLGQASNFVGDLSVSDIGSPPALVEEIGKGNLRWSESREFAQFALPRKADANKGNYGHALIVAGSVGKSGAAVLASWAALRAGAGLVTVATPADVLPIIAAHTPEIMTEPLASTSAGTISLRGLEQGRFDALLKGKRALAMGPGLSTQDETQKFVRTVVDQRSSVPLILDADGLNAFAGRAADMRKDPSPPRAPLALTPHPGEMARLVGGTAQDVQARRLDLALKSAAEWNAYVILKGHHTIVAAPSDQAFINSTGNPGMGTGGTGDVLTGMLAGLTAQFGADDWARALAFGVYLHGLAGDIAYADFAEAPLMASDLIRAIPRAYQQFYSECGRA